MGERGREVREFIDRELSEARESTVVIAVPSDSSPLMRTRGAYVATAIAEYFRDRGRDVLLVMDSITRFAFAAREIGRFVDIAHLKRVYLESGPAGFLETLAPVGRTLWSELTPLGRQRLRKS